MTKAVASDDVSAQLDHAYCDSVGPDAVLGGKGRSALAPRALVAPVARGGRDVGRVTAIVGESSAVLARRMGVPLCLL